MPDCVSECLIILSWDAGEEAGLLEKSRQPLYTHTRTHTHTHTQAISNFASKSEKQEFGLLTTAFAANVPDNK